MDHLLLQGNKEQAFLKDTELDAAKIDFDPKAKRLILISCLAALCVGNMMLDAVYAFIPLYVAEMNSSTDDGVFREALWTDDVDLTKIQTTLILSIFSVAQIVFAPFNAYIKNKLGSKNTMLIGFFIITISSFGLGVIAVFDHSSTFLYSALTLRFFQGQGDVLL